VGSRVLKILSKSLASKHPPLPDRQVQAEPPPAEQTSFPAR
jgi:hypothetical protein